MRFGVHLSTRHGLQRTVEEAKHLKCDTIQIFTRSPRMWRTRTLEDGEAEIFRHALASAHIYPLIVHTPYLPNLCTSDPALYQKSLRAFQEDIERAQMFRAQYLVIHPGAYSPEKQESEGYQNLVAALDTVFKPSISLTVLLENMSGGGRRLGSSFEKFSWVISHSKLSEHLGICLDTCHAVGAGFDLSTKKGIDELIKEIDRTIGLKKIKLLHLNDSKSPCGSHFDRHEHIGKGYIGEEGFKYLLTHPAFRDLPAILETPKDPPDADVQNLNLARKLADSKIA